MGHDTVLKARTAPEAELFGQYLAELAGIAEAKCGA
jgi:hypothetical protein